MTKDRNPVKLKKMTLKDLKPHLVFGLILIASIAIIVSLNGISWLSQQMKNIFNFSLLGFITLLWGAYNSKK